jgi:DNA-directed RNA polymerase subunit E'/Rpb7
MTTRALSSASNGASAKSNNFGGDADTAVKPAAPYAKSLLNIRVALAITEIGNHIKDRLTKKIVALVEGRCIEHGYIMPASVVLMAHSSGMVFGDMIEFNAIYECYVCFPVEGLKLDAIARTITKAGIHAEVVDSHGNIPITVFIAREHHHNETHFASVSESDKITATVIGMRFELNDPYICVIASLDTV